MIEAGSPWEMRKARTEPEDCLCVCSLTDFEALICGLVKKTALSPKDALGHLEALYLVRTRRSCIFKRNVFSLLFLFCIWSPQCTSV